MFEMRFRPVATTIVGVLLLLAQPAAAGDGDGLVFRALGFYRGVENISETEIRCEIPTNSSAIPDGGFSMGLFDALYYPDRFNAAANPCGGWIQLQNNMISQGINVTRVVLKMKIPGAKRYRDQVPTRRNWPLACRKLRKQVLFVGMRLDPAFSFGTGGSQSGEPNVALAQLFPMLSTQALRCLQEQYDVVPVSELSSFPVVFRARAFGVTDAGKRVITQRARYTLTLYRR